MNRIASRSTAAVVLVLLLLGGLGFFLGEYFNKAENWVLFSGSPHVYNNGRLSSGVITDRSGILLADLREGRSYSTDETLRKAVLHWVGDRQGNVSVPYMDYFTETLLAYDNAELQFFMADEAVITDLNNYADHIHVAGKVTYRLAEAMPTGAYRMTGENRMEMLDGLRQLVVNYDYDQIWE